MCLHIHLQSEHQDNLPGNGKLPLTQLQRSVQSHRHLMSLLRIYWESGGMLRLHISKEILSRSQKNDMNILMGILNCAISNQANDLTSFPF